ncbi:MAG: ribosome silencing factor [Chitinivibrionales bacterium]|nr:ribosome silencing factor [Chitinivibrionales bacterium]MBD3357123.1 ribosome silencing factor [Chitinivibrionales bacterium]
MNSEKNPKLEGKALAEQAAEKALDKKAEELVLIDLRATSGVADWFLICQGNSPAQNRAIASAVERGLREHGARPWQEEGLEEGRWVLLDYVDVVVHIMLPEVREFYEIELLWNECPQTSIESEHEGDESEVSEW